MTGRVQLRYWAKHERDGVEHLEWMQLVPGSTAQYVVQQLLPMFLRIRSSQATKSNNVTSRSEDSLSVPLCRGTTAVGIVFPQKVEKPFSNVLPRSGL